MSTASTPLPIVRLHLLARADAPLQLPPYAGSMLRGAFGHALKALALLPHTDGQPCALQASCAYCQVFAPTPQREHALQKFSQMPAPYVIEPPMPGQPTVLAAGQTFGFGLVLIGKALEHLPVIVSAFEQALRRGLGTRTTACTLLQVQQSQQGGDGPMLWQRGSSDYSQLQATLPAPPPIGQHATLKLLTPLRIQYQNKPAGQRDLTARTLLITLARRYQLLLDTQLGALAPQQDFSALTAQAEAVALDASGLRWFDWQRYSSRQQQSMKLGGLLGTLRLHGDLAPFGHLLHLGQWLHVGKETTFGLGGYAVAMPAVVPAPPAASAAASSALA